MNTLDKITYITLPPSFMVDLGSLKMDPAIKLPFSIPENREKLEKEDYTVQNLMSGLITVVAFDEKNENIDYYKSLIPAIDKDIVDKLNTAAIAKEQKKDYEFALLLFKAVYHLRPDNESCINLATLYSYMAVDAASKGDDNKEYIKNARDTLLSGIKKFGETEELLYELASFEAFMANLDEAKEYILRYLEIAPEGERKEEIKKLYSEVSFKIDNREKIEEAYDFLSMGESDRALPIIEGFIKENPKMWNGYFLKGWALRIKKEYEEAVKCFMKCLEMGISNAEIYNELSLCELSSGKRELAEIYLETAYDLDEENLTVITNLAYLMLEDGEYDKAREYLEKARYIASNDTIVDALIRKYEEKTGEKIGSLIHEEIVEGELAKDGGDIKDRLFDSFEKTDESVCGCGTAEDDI